MVTNLFSFGGILTFTGAALLLAADPGPAAGQTGGRRGAGFGAPGGIAFGARGVAPAGARLGGMGGVPSGGRGVAPPAAATGARFGGFRGGYSPAGSSRRFAPGYGSGYTSRAPGYYYLPGYLPYSYGAYGVPSVLYPSFGLYSPFGGSRYGPGYFDIYGGEDYAPPSENAPPEESPESTPPRAEYPNTIDLVPETAARVTVEVPPGAQLWFEGTKTTSTGPLRKFRTPRLEPGREYAYRVRATWQENGRTVTQTQDITVAAGARVRVRFPVGRGTGGQTGPER